VRTLLIYESLYGNTHLVANCIAEGLRERHEVEVVPVSRATVDLLDDSDAIVVGQPDRRSGNRGQR
jgi:menaquinone-dependent protoporphyrinogen IX oxidase